MQERAQIGRRLAWLSGLRILVLLGTLAAVALLDAGQSLSLGTPTSNVLLGTVGVGLGVAAVFAALLRRGRFLEPLAHVQLVVDQLGWTAIAYATGGVASVAATLYGITCVMGAAVLGVQGVLTSAVTGAVLFAGLGALLAGGVVSPPLGLPGAYPTEPREVLYYLALNLLALVVVALLAGYLAERLRITGGELVEATLRAREAEQLAVLGRFAAGLAHEIRNPLGSIAGSVDLLAAGPELTEEDRLLCGIISRETSRLNDLATDMLDLARPRKPELLPVDVASLAADVVKLASASGRGADVPLHYDGPASGVLLVADSAQMKQILWNLVRNAVQASTAGTPVTVRVAQDGDRVVVEVRDAGPGIPESARDRLFDAFFTTRSHGVGIGLAVVKRIVDEHAFRIEVESGPEGGALFRVTAPAA